MKNVIKKVVALGAGAAMMGATLVGAMAADLSQYPAPFVKNGKFDTLLVVGDSAISADVIGAVDIATSLQYAMKQSVTSTTATTTVADGIQLVTSSQKLQLNDTLISTKSLLTSSDLPDLLKDGTVTSTEGDVATVKTKIVVPAALILFDKKSSDLGDYPTSYVDFSTGSPNLNITIEFSPAINLSQSGGKVLTLMGKEYTIGQAAADVSTTKITLYSAAVDQTFTAGQSATVNAGGQDVSVEVIGVNTQSTTATATIKINGESASVTQGLTTTIGGQKVYVKDIFAYTQPVGGGGVRLFIGSEKLVLDSGSNAVTKGTSNTIVSGVGCVISAPSNKHSMITLSIAPKNLDSYVNYLGEGKEFVDPIFGAVKLVYSGPTPKYDDTTSRDYVKLVPSGDKDLQLTFTNYAGDKYDMVVLQGNSSNNNVSLSNGDNTIHVANNQQILRNEYFVIRDNEYSRILRLVSFSNSSTTQQITVRDMANGQSQIWSHNGASGTMTYDGKTYTFGVQPVAGTPSEGNITFAAGASNLLFTKQGANITLPATNAQSDTATFRLTEETQYNSQGTPDDRGVISTVASFSDGQTGNDMVLSTPTYAATAGNAAGTFAFKLWGTSGYDNRAVTPYGTYLKWNSDTSTYRLEMYYSGSETSYNVFVAPTAAAVSTSTTSSVTISAVQVGAAKLASEISDVSAQNLIVVGGPCANAIAAKLMGNPSNCVAGFEEGKATVALYTQSTGKVALLVAGMTAQDTRRASQAVASGKLASLPAGTATATVTTITATPTVTVATQ